MSIATKLVTDFVTGAHNLRNAVAGMTRDQLVARPVAGKWSTLEVVCHLVDSDQAWLHRMKRVIAEDRPLLIGYDETRFAGSLAYHDRDLDDEMALFEQGRRQLGRILETLPADALKRTGVHSERGLVTLEEMIQVEIDHVAHHLRFVVEKRRALGC